MIDRTWTNGLAARLGLGAAAAILLLSGCTSTKDKTAAGSSTPASLEVTVDDADAPVGPTVSSTTPDGYPDFSGSLTAASVQMSNEEAGDLQRKLSSLGAARRSGAISEAEYQRRVQELRKLAAEHGAETQAQITK
ncbi:SHOCT domain-containing protein [Rhizobium daejeonense]|uniref:SHOCT domain-containing protein n=1 Tax=Rhizobium daejeonense TaxID=240521 RepID=A0A6M1SBX2_9HYPH|nr:SHOCT domain-containing protein [Rhizobium daejeonense]NGO64256.1 SHOCT domain-containing protein [Rhizobium daejeonense]